MAGIRKEVEEVLSAELGEFVSGLDEDGETGRVMGFVVSSDFDRLDQPKRQEKLKALLKRKFDSNELLRIGPIVTMTPEEAAIDEMAD